jgi:hypothetical protein
MALLSCTVHSAFSGTYLMPMMFRLLTHFPSSHDCDFIELCSGTFLLEGCNRSAGQENIHFLLNHKVSSKVQKPSTGSISEALKSKRSTCACLKYELILHVLPTFLYTDRAASEAYSQLVEALCYSAERHGLSCVRFPMRSLQSYDPGVDSASNRNEHQEYSWN